MPEEVVKSPNTINIVYTGEEDRVYCSGYFFDNGVPVQVPNLVGKIILTNSSFKEAKEVKK